VAAAAEAAASALVFIRHDVMRPRASKVQVLSLFTSGFTACSPIAAPDAATAAAAAATYLLQSKLL
jgi:hypothetical protein